MSFIQEGDPTPDNQPEPLFKLGQVVATPGAIKTMQQADQDPLALISRHVVGDWGTVPDEDKLENDLSVQQGFRILSAYELPGGEKIWLITEADRSATTLLRPDEY